MATRPQRAKYRPDPAPHDDCQCTMATARLKNSSAKVTHQFPYHDKDGVRAFSRFRFEIPPNETHSDGDKTFRYCQHYDRTNTEHVTMPYGLPRLLEAAATGQPVYLVEGEKDCEAIWEHGNAYATTTHLGTRFPIEVAQYFKGVAKVLSMTDRDHLEEKHQKNFHDPEKLMDFPGSVSGLRRYRAFKSLDIPVATYEVRHGKDAFDLLVTHGKDLTQVRRVYLDVPKSGPLVGKIKFENTLKGRAPKEAGNSRSTSLQLSRADLPEGPGMARFVAALEAKGFYLEKIGPTRYKTNCPHPEHEDHNPSFEFEQGDKGVVMTCESGQCNYGKDGVKKICEFLGIRAYDLFDSSKVKSTEAGPKPTEAEDGRAFAPDAADPMEVARHIADTFVFDDEEALLCHEDDIWMYTGTHWETVHKNRIESRLYRRMDKEMVLKLVDGEWKPQRWAPTSGKIGNLLEAVKATRIADELPTFNAWQDTPPGEGVFVPMKNGILHVDEAVLRPSTPRYFSSWALPFDYDPDAVCPDWIAFLEDVFDGDSESIRLVQQWFGYIVSGRTDLEKILVIIGPSRSGKGTIAEVLEALVGGGNYEGFTLKSLSGEFGLQNLVGKSVMVDSDARSALKAEDMQTAIERLLSLSANDKVIVNRKNKLPISVRMGIRPVIMSNELPKFMDSSNAINDRMMMIKMRKSYLGKEDPTLKGRVKAEVQGVLNWALEGLADLEETGKFIQPASASNYIEAMSTGASPHEQFLQQVCTIGAADDEDVWDHFDNIKASWKAWCEEQEMKPGQPNHLMSRLTPIITRLGGDLRSGFRDINGNKKTRVWVGISVQPESDKVKSSPANQGK